MRNLLAKILGRRRSRSASEGEGVNAAGVQPGLWSSTPPTVSPATPATTPVTPPSAPERNPFAAPAESAGRKPLFTPGRSSPSGSVWSRAAAWIGWPIRAGAHRRLFPTNDQLELMLGRPNPPARNRNLEIGLPARVRRSDASARLSKVIYESKPAAAAEATRMMEESDRAYARLRGRRLESLRVDDD